MAPTGGLTVPSGDPDRTCSPDEEARLTQNLYALTEGIHRGSFSGAAVDVRLLCALHYNIFLGVRAHAGRVRSSDFGSEFLTFGPHRSMPRGDVQGELTAVFARFGRFLQAAEAHPDDADYERAVLNAAVLLHADLIRIHPFEDGNGRSCRALMNVVLVRLGLLPVALEAPKQEYLACLNHYFRTGESDPLTDLILRLYPL